jgi:hypothetical protein
VLNYDIEVLDFDIEETSISKYFEVEAYSDGHRLRATDGPQGPWQAQTPPP